MTPVQQRRAPSIIAGTRSGVRGTRFRRGESSESASATALAIAAGAASDHVAPAELGAIDTELACGHVDEPLRGRHPDRLPDTAVQA